MPPDEDVVLAELGPRAVIRRAVDLLMEDDGVSRDEAFELLVRRSARSDLKVRELAAQIVTRNDT